MRNNYKTSAKGIEFIAGHEGEILKVYKDPVGLPTLGVGHLLTAAELREMPVGTRITRAQSRQYLAKDLRKAETAVLESVTVPITQNQFDALVSFTFNVGVGGFRRSSVLRNLNKRKFSEAADSFLLWNKAGGKVLKGLTRRRKEERALFLTPDSAALPTTQLTGKAIQPEEPGGSTTATQPPINSTEQGTEIKATEQKGEQTLEVTAKNEQDVTEKAVVNAPLPYQGVGFWAVVKRDLAAATGGNLSLSGLAEYAQQASGWPEWVIGIIQKLAVGVLIATIGYFVFRCVHYLVDRWQQNEKSKTEAMSKTDIQRKDIEWV